ncbi:protein-L-isoaspartate O-methyltransferase family protein [Devosia rhizoryzae]|uniref:Protein-L-isoaspartate O-methyltransferase n=1 Tax=Devosia rhizoryzae TaxID=2774137 RepID=A0ABX7C983_9HYPH|nr:methyltransferase domain-containing protein [Devosia rhizoryzae]QQR40833.1 methyltransferase domain-containing protein [Devosia rhizoryzae]
MVAIGSPVAYSRPAYAFPPDVFFMVDFTTARRAMIDSQVSAAGVTERRLLASMGRLPREIFVPEDRRGLAYIDDLHALGNGRFLPSPAIFARLAQLADVKETDRVLELGAGTGYGTAVLASLAHHVTGLETDTNLADQARANLAALAVLNAAIVSGTVDDLAEQRFDVILVEGALEAEPADLLTRLSPNGRLVTLIRRGRVAVAHRYRPGRDGFKKETHFDATLPALFPVAHAEEFVF